MGKWEDLDKKRKLMEDELACIRRDIDKLAKEPVFVGLSITSALAPTEGVSFKELAAKLEYLRERQVELENKLTDLKKGTLVVALSSQNTKELENRNRNLYDDLKRAESEIRRLQMESMSFYSDKSEVDRLKKENRKIQGIAQDSQYMEKHYQAKYEQALKDLEKKKKEKKSDLMDFIIPMVAMGAIILIATLSLYFSG